jgi:POT family proton-dependent oligopeptide transporter
MYVVLILTFFCMVFFAFYEQAGSSISNFTDRNVRRVFATTTARVIGPKDVGKTISLQPTQEQLGYHNGGEIFTLGVLNKLRQPPDADKDRDQDPNKDTKKKKDFEIPWKVSQDNVGMKVVRRDDEIPASLFQSVNPVCIMLLGLVFSAAWSYLGRRGLEPSTPLKFALGLLQLGLGFGVFWVGAQLADQRGMVAAGWLLLGYLLHTTGELCLSPVGLSMITKLAPAVLVSTVMGAWFLSTAFSQFLASTIAIFTDAGKTIPAPKVTLPIYADVYGMIAVAAAVSAVICFALVPLLKKWMHEGEPANS